MITLTASFINKNNIVTQWIDYEVPDDYIKENIFPIITQDIKNYDSFAKSIRIYQIISSFKDLSFNETH